MPRPRPLVLIILDGWGVAKPSPSNAISEAKTPNFDRWLKEYSNTTLQASGKAVGLPDRQMGNSEVGHLNIGAGRIVPQEFTRISDAIEKGSFFNNPVLIQAAENTKKLNTHLHLMGLLSDGGVHSHITHLFALLEFCKEKNISPVLHLFLDGRDVPPKSALTYIEQLQEKIDELKCGQIATIMGRYYAMDRDRRWDRVQKAYDAMVYGKGYEAESATEAIKKAYARGETDEFVKPTIIVSSEQLAVSSKDRGLSPDQSGGDCPLIEENDSVVFFNFRPDRAREITRAFIDPDFDGFDRGAHPPHVFFASMTQYDETFDMPVAYLPTRPKEILADILAQHKLKQLRIAETEKYAHVTFFFNGGEENKRPLEERILIPSPKVATYDLKPEMSANEVTAEVIKWINSEKFDVIILNFANPDMVGHTGILEAAVIAIETIDNNLGKIVDVVRQKGGVALITADHGNAEKMAEPSTDKPHTAHTTDKVPFLLIPSSLGVLSLRYPADKSGDTPPKEGCPHPKQRAIGLPAIACGFRRWQAGSPPARHPSALKLRNDGILADIAPTMLDILGIEKPMEMTGKSLIL